MIEYTLTITHPDGSVTTDRAAGNTPRTARVAARGLARQYELDGCTVKIGKAVRT